ncbi:HalOD1 output domain-containing protein [Haladaptatus pallidirubidus]|uniref:Halobacterial output domain-containing protein n=1 Tax=Haladaptatus pallidirubidus TaxID=1008152 RepID=A0AAV3ULI3_9EURY|nr:HalOD1 output domain-containing protein [Haladaptatus pallidirubidus]
MEATSTDTGNNTDLIHQFSFDEDETDSIVVAVSKAVSQVTDTPIEEMPPLQETIDCDALEVVFKSFDVENAPGVGQVQFPFHDCTVRIDTTGTVQVYDEGPRFSPDDSGC